uniref:Proteinase inhibitor I42 chagasin domain-containing protein n=1 Tax=Hemiselmis tepida TaxID=464990 RepID=A0A7S0W6H6_9CRYP|mmetsp:Transcript_5639/g.14464  ORF Transcript_5639/g.14464 Transcript_5639/m.14464 type:complete len:136 (+) Transcript_5639:23-430(+)|eukprot:CAMPEP_0174927082 /NCGR_PEP_ID=MMETSP1355-20121228/17834_1 /TAXON_ID=464990 /ORGANISM="Hemiselmis tepida, Strain CCMP443" /LENGTH=135 /DNA_ID=CAMNT_0016173167 /DNA_START=20 /DNA_END=427 /DNA_ORIENTATION=-
MRVAALLLFLTLTCLIGLAHAAGQVVSFMGDSDHFEVTRFVEGPVGMEVEIRLPKSHGRKWAAMPSVDTATGNRRDAKQLSTIVKRLGQTDSEEMQTFSFKVEKAGIALLGVEMLEADDTIDEPVVRAHVTVKAA